MKDRFLAIYKDVLQKAKAFCKRATGLVCAFAKSIPKKIAVFWGKSFKKKTLSPEEEMVHAVEAAMGGTMPSGTGKKKYMIAAGILGAVSILLIFCFFTSPGRSFLMNTASRIAARVAFSRIKDPTPEQTGENTGFEYNIDPKIDYDLGLNEEELLKITIIPLQPTGVSHGRNDGGSEPKDTPTPTFTPSPTISPVPKDPNIVNILLIGEENLNDGRRGRSDAVLIATYNKKSGSVKLTSLLRDMYVWIPDSETKTSSQDKLNTAYAWGGAKLLMQTITLNFGIQCDSYVIIDFDGFVNVIDTLGGVDVSLSEAEADYLNTTNYISDPKQRTMKPGVNHMSGVQALGFCRIRGETLLSADGKKYDFGRTSRQRIVLNAVFEKFKKSNYLTLYRLMTECLQYVTAPADLEKTAAECLNIAIGKNLSSITMETERIPVLGHYEGIKIPVGVNAATGKTIETEVLSFDSENVNVLRKFIYGY